MQAWLAPWKHAYPPLSLSCQIWWSKHRTVINRDPAEKCDPFAFEGHSKSLEPTQIDRLVPMCSYYWSIVGLSTGRSRTVSAINGNFCVYCYFSTPVYLTPSPVTVVGLQKLVMRLSISFRYNTSVWQTDRRTGVQICDNNIALYMDMLTRDETQTYLMHYLHRVTSKCKHWDIGIIPENLMHRNITIRNAGKK